MPEYLIKGELMTLVGLYVTGIGAGAVQTSKRYYEVVIRLSVTDHG